MPWFTDDHRYAYGSSTMSAFYCQNAHALLDVVGQCFDVTLKLPVAYRL